MREIRNMQPNYNGVILHQTSGLVASLDLNPISRNKVRDILIFILAKIAKSTVLLDQHVVR
jgi:hypothetical protein